MRAQLQERRAGPLAEGDFVRMRRQASLFRSLFDAVVAANATAKSNAKPNADANANMPALSLDIAARDLEESLYPWPATGSKFTSVHHLASSFSGRGIVMTAGQWHFKLARHAATVVRKLGSKLPIELFYVGDEDLPKQYRDKLEQIDGLKTVDLKQFMDTKGPSINGWAVKPFSMLFSSFQEIIFLDADALFFQPPEVLFDWNIYKQTGSVFFMDRTLFGGGDSAGRDFFLKMVPEPSRYAQTTGRLFRKLSQHEGESGVIVWNKKRNLHAVLLTCVMNSEPHRKHVYKAYHGDKESYWIAHEALQMPYSWAPGAGGTIGYLKENTTDAVCGGLYHPDDNFKPLWFNGGIMRNKYTEEGQTGMMLTHWATDRTFKDPKWDWETKTSPFCLHAQNPKTDMAELTTSEKAIAEMMLSTWLELERDVGSDR
eukprot:jgi/Hompol1/5161/HPOL_004188-RA